MLRRLFIPLALATLLAASSIGATLGHADQHEPAVYPYDCEGPAPDAEPGTPEWFVRDANNLSCTEQRQIDKSQHPNAFTMPIGAPANDAYRTPSRHDNVRVRFSTPSIPGVSSVEVYRPCRTLETALDECPGMPQELERFDPPYPAAILLHGGGSRKELHWYSSQTLAESGYLVVTPDGAGQGAANSILNWLYTQPDFDGVRVGIAGHSIGGDAAAIVAHNDTRIGALVGWDRAGLSSPPQNRRSDLPAIYLVSDYACPAPLVCPPRPYASKPNPADRGPKTADFGLTKEAGADTMQVGLRGTTHFDWVPLLLAGNRYGEIMIVHYTVVWFDRYLRGKFVPTGDPDADAAEEAKRLAIAQDAFDRLTATVYDGYIDRLNISQGFWDPMKAIETADPFYGGNVPYTLAGKPVRDRLSFYFDSMCFLTVPGTSVRAESSDMRASGCKIVP